MVPYRTGQTEAETKFESHDVQEHIQVIIPVVETGIEPDILKVNFRSDM